MKTKVILGVSVIISIIFLAYGSIKAAEAEGYAIEAARQARLAKAEVERANVLVEHAQNLLRMRKRRSWRRKNL